jgi:YesN/AraC family two-component response regulator
MIVMTGHGTVDSARRVIQAGCDEYLLKPIENFDELELVVKRCIDRRRMLLQAIVYKRLSMAKSRMIHDVVDTLADPSHSLLTATDLLIDAIQEKNYEKSLALIEKVRMRVNDLIDIVGKFAESSDRLKEMEM